MSAATAQIGIDIGGTFTDFVIYHPISGSLETFKLLSTPKNPAEAVIEGLRRIEATLEPGVGMKVIHGSTVATNALLERKGARTALVTTRGFGDLLQIGRQNRPELYSFSANPPPALVPPELRFEVDERVSSTGEALRPLDPTEIDALITEMRAAGVESVAICLLFSFLHPEHERLLAERLRTAGYFVSASSEVLPEFREYERLSTTAVNAYVSPALDSYLDHLEQAVPGTPMRVMQSNGGNISLSEARRSGVRCILSGPAGGVVGAQYLAGQTQPVRVITFDMGGTSTDVALIDGAPRLTTEAAVGGCPIAVPLLDIHTIGAGGGSIAAIDAGGALRVGPHSAGADPGPACYGRGLLPTVTDANLVLGRLAAEYFLGGSMPLDAGRARYVFEKLGNELHLDPVRAAQGVIAIVNAHMERALRVISVERGFDPREFKLLSFGGAGGLHAADLARGLGIRTVIVPPLASTLSAFGMLAADVIRDYSQTVMLPSETPVETLRSRIAPLIEQARRDLFTEGVQEQAICIEPAADLRYRGQSYELTAAFDPTASSVLDLLAEFHHLHEQLYGYSHPESAVEIVNLRLRAIGRVQPPAISAKIAAEADPSAALIGERTMIFESGAHSARFYRAEQLLPGNRLTGPALVGRADTTVLIGPTDTADVDSYGNLHLQIGPPTSSVSGLASKRPAPEPAQAKTATH